MDKLQKAQKQFSTTRVIKLLALIYVIGYVLYTVGIFIVVGLYDRDALSFNLLLAGIIWPVTLLATIPS